MECGRPQEAGRCRHFADAADVVPTRQRIKLQFVCVGFERAQALFDLLTSLAASPLASGVRRCKTSCTEVASSVNQCLRKQVHCMPDSHSVRDEIVRRVRESSTSLRCARVGDARDPALSLRARSASRIVPRLPRSTTARRTHPSLRARLASVRSAAIAAMSSPQDCADALTDRIRFARQAAPIVGVCFDYRIVRQRPVEPAGWRHRRAISVSRRLFGLRVTPSRARSVAEPLPSPGSRPDVLFQLA